MVTTRKMAKTTPNEASTSGSRRRGLNGGRDGFEGSGGEAAGWVMAVADGRGAATAAVGTRGVGLFQRQV